MGDIDKQQPDRDQDDPKAEARQTGSTPIEDLPEENDGDPTRPGTSGASTTQG